MIEADFRRLAKAARSLPGDYGTGYSAGLRRLYHGDTFGTPQEHAARMARADDLGRGYRDALAGVEPTTAAAGSNTELLVACGEALYGPQWQTPMARDLEVADRTVRRWVAGSSPVPAGLHTDLLRLIKGRAEDLACMAERLKAEIAR